MGKKEKVIEINPLVIKQIQDDLETDGVCFYEVENVPQVFIDKNLIHPDVLEKCSCVAVAASGCPDEGRNYIFAAGCRVDSVNGSVVVDLDPIVMIADLESGTPAPSGCIRFHGNFEGRTEGENLKIDKVDVAVSVLRKDIKASKKSFKDAPKRFTNAMHFMAKSYRRKIG